MDRAELHATRLAHVSTVAADLLRAAAATRSADGVHARGERREAMGQTCGTCCCGKDRRASGVLNDSLQEKLLDEETNVTVFDETAGSQSQAPRGPEQSKSEVDAAQTKSVWTREASSLGTDEVDGDGHNYIHRKMTGDDDDEDDDEKGDSKRNSAQKRAQAPQRESSSYASHAWDLDERAAESSCITSRESDASSRQLDEDEDGDEHSSAAAGTPDAARLQRLVSDASVRSAVDDSYASSYELAHDQSQLFDEGDEDAEAAHRLRNTSARVFDDDDTSPSSSRALHEGNESDDDDASASASVRSFLETESSPTRSFAESRRVMDSAADATSSSATAIEANQKSSQRGKKKSKRSPRSKRR